MRSICWGTRCLVVSCDASSVSILRTRLPGAKHTSPLLLRLFSSNSSSPFRITSIPPTCTCRSCTMPTHQKRRRSYVPAPVPSKPTCVHGRMSASFCMRMYFISNSRAMVPGECPRCDNLTRRLDLPLGSHCDPFDWSRSMHRKLHGMIITPNANKRTTS
jgi:hypothetical protein